jgi:uncharacterized RDD family membrane protein YckC
MDSAGPQPDNRTLGPGSPNSSLLVRFAARIVDSLVVAVVGVLLGVAMEFSPLWLVIQAFWVYAYFVLFDVGAGTTPGKRLFGLKLLGPQGGRPTLAQAAAREAFTLVGAVPFAGPVLFLAAWITIAFTINSSPTGQGIHDRVGGGTRVAGT